jgi:hypothetical protein
MKSYDNFPRTQEKNTGWDEVLHSCIGGLINSTGEFKYLKGT